ncbi:hypothetical protein SAMN05192582_11602 [Bacteroides ovatus]|uniref:Uncharacterized protein n=1 Tax=Bacteroides ovatus TaxID=28116 RepID=A0A1G8RVW1_BACOV|nr:hypothetical protein SAMN05192582_11602 [Bacteroides ovatus]
MIKTILSVLSLFVMLSCSMTGKKDIKQQPGMCAKLPMAADGIVRLSKIEVYPEYLVYNNRKVYQIIIEK